MLLLLPISQGHEWGWTSARTLGSFAGAAVMAGVWVLIERKVREPLVDMRMFVHRPVLMPTSPASSSDSACSPTSSASPTSSRRPQEIAGYGFDASSCAPPSSSCCPSDRLAGGRPVRRHSSYARIGPRFTLALGGGRRRRLRLAGPAPPHRLGDRAGMVVGAAISFGYAAMPALIVAGVPHHQTGIANGINSISRSTGSAIGSALATTLLASKTIEHLPAGVPPLPAESQFTLSFAIAGVAFAFVPVIALVGLKRQRQAPVRRPAAETAPEPAAADDGLTTHPICTTAICTTRTTTAPRSTTVKAITRRHSRRPGRLAGRRRTAAQPGGPHPRKGDRHPLLTVA